MSNWTLEELLEAPEHTVTTRRGHLQGVHYTGEPYHGKPTRVAAWMGVPEGPERSLPGMVLLHGGGGKAFAEWVELWNRRGYAAIAMDFGGMDLDGTPMDQPGPSQDHEAKFDVAGGWENIWTCHAIAAALRGHSLLATDPRVDPERVGVTGISWGGYLACIVAGVDPRPACAVPVYGCGHLEMGSTPVWMERFHTMSEQDRTWWLEHCDPASYLPGAEMPMLFVSGTNDFAYPLNILQASLREVSGPASMCVRHEMQHGHAAGWNPVEIGLFADAHLRGTAGLPVLGEPTVEDGRVRATVESDFEITRAEVLFTRAKGTWQDRRVNIL
ncbi:MAG: alpha/beta hydrolase family protein, partial [Planctomycetota bacterium]